MSYLGIPYWVEHDENGNPQNNVWVKVNLTANQPLEFYVYYGSSTAPSYSDGDSVFEFFDDFDGTTKFSHLRGDGSYGFENSMLYITGASDGYTAFQSPLLNLQNKIVIQAKTYAYDWDEIFTIGISIEETLGTGQQINYIIKNGYDFDWWGWAGGEHGLRTIQNSDVTVDDHDAYPEFYSATNNHYYMMGGAYDGNTLYHFKPVDITNNSTYIIESDHSRNDNIFSGYIWKRIMMGVWKGAKWGVDYLFVRKYSSTEPTIQYGSEESGSWTIDGYTYTKRRKVTITSSEDLQDYQVALDYSQFGDDTLYVGEPIYPYWIEHDENNNPSNNVWVKVDNIPAGGTKTIYAIKESGYSPDGDSVFEFFDDFNGTSLDMSKWDTFGSGSVSVSDGLLKIHTASSGSPTTGIATDYKINTPFITEASVVSIDNGRGELTTFESSKTSTWYNDNDWISTIYYEKSSNSVKGNVKFNGNWQTGQTISSESVPTILKSIIAPDYVKLCSESDCITYNGALPDSYISLNHQPYPNAGNYWVDWVRVRKYSPTEPSATVTNKGSYYQIDITNTGTQDLQDYQVAIPINELNITSTTESIKFTDVGPEEEKKNKTIHFSHNF